MCLWLVVGKAGAPIFVGDLPATPHAAGDIVAPAGEVVEAHRLSTGSQWARVIAHDARRLLVQHSELRSNLSRDEALRMLMSPDDSDDEDNERAYYLRIDGADDEVMPFGGRRRGGGELWLSRRLLRPVLRRQPPPLAPRAPVDSLKRLKTMVGRKVEAAPPLRAFEQALTDDVIATLVDRGFAVVDNALPAALCRKLRGEMEALEANGQMWNSRSYGGDDDGAPHAHINETQLDYKQVRLHAPTFGRMEHDPSLVERMRGVPGLEALASQHVRIQINSGHGGCYTMHTDMGTGPTKDSGQTLCLTALIYLNEDWEPGDGGELRVFPFPNPAELIAPLMGRLVLFEPRMVHDVLPNFKKRYCFTLWCSKKTVYSGALDTPVQLASNQVDHATLQKAELEPRLAVGARICEDWRREQGHFVPYDRDRSVKGDAQSPLPSLPSLPPLPPLPPSLHSLFLPEMRLLLVRIVHRADEIASIAQSHKGTDTGKRMVEGISHFHEMILRSNPKWVIDLLEQLPVAHAGGERAREESEAAKDDDVVLPAELRGAIHRLAPWWIA